MHNRTTLRRSRATTRLIGPSNGSYDEPMHDRRHGQELRNPHVRALLVLTARAEPVSSAAGSSARPLAHIFSDVFGPLSEQQPVQHWRLRDQLPQSRSLALARARLLSRAVPLCGGVPVGVAHRAARRCRGRSLDQDHESFPEYRAGGWHTVDKLISDRVKEPCRACRPICPTSERARAGCPPPALSLDPRCRSPLSGLRWCCSPPRDILSPKSPP